MNHFANCTVEGFVTDDLAVRITKTGKKVTTFNLAINQYGKTEEEPPRVSFLHIEVWDQELEIKKANRISVTGNLRQDRWEDEKGKVRSRIKVVANEIRVL